MLAKQKQFASKKNPSNKSVALCMLIWWMYFCPIRLAL